MESSHFSGYCRQMSAQAIAGLSAFETKAELDLSTGLDIRVALVAGRLLIEDAPEVDSELDSQLMRLANAAPAQWASLADLAGHRRPIYLPLVFHLFLRAWGLRVNRPLPEAVQSIASHIQENLQKQAVREEVGQVLWHFLCLAQYSQLVGDRPLNDWAMQQVLEQVRQQGQDGSLHPHDPADSLDAWTYRELVGLHALFNMAVLWQHKALKYRCQEVVQYHLENTQPDNTTSQPWAVAAFLTDPIACSFGEQQLHDATTQGRLSAGQGVGLVASYLLADAYSVLSRFSSL